ncbi:MAG: hypothetical protein QGF78_05680 [Candidatus Bathyarchaeota archaeon]|jgi:hypothetical protein|nr:hypothetical protein [Candidatus Bathyarchaeota archaeon]
MQRDEFRYPFSIIRFFIPEFITRLRRNEEVTDKPSYRQGIAMTSLLLPAYLRKGFLSFGDLMRVAVSTSKVENQNLAEHLAHAILPYADEAGVNLNMNEEKYLSLLSQRSDDLIRYNPSDSEKPDYGAPQAVHGFDIDSLKEHFGQPDIGVGPGDDELLKVAVRKYTGKRDNFPRKRLTEYLKRNLLKLGQGFQRSAEVSMKPLLRPFEQGDDTDDIDEERSLENIFSQGKSMDEVLYRDFLIRKRSKKKKAIVFILDISNTMFYELEGLTSIHYSVLSLIPLLWSLRKERYGLIFYESNSHIQKALHEERDIDQVIDNLLILVTSTTGDVESIIRGKHSVQTWGGTVPQMSLRWAMEQLEASAKREERICFYFSDFVLQEPGSDPQLEYITIIKRMVGQGIHVIACVSPLASGKIFSPYTRETLKRVREAGGTIIDTVKPSGFLEEVRAFMERL